MLLTLSFGIDRVRNIGISRSSCTQFLTELIKFELKPAVVLRGWEFDLNFSLEIKSLDVIMQSWTFFLDNLFLVYGPW